MIAAETKPAFEGFIANTQDALLVFEACRRGVAPRARNRLSDAERKAIVSGCVFVFSEEESRIKRWTDGRRWSPSRILNNFLIYREKLDSEDPNDDAEAVDDLDDETVMSPEDTSVLSPTSGADAGGSPIDVKPDVFKKSIVGGHRGEALYKKGGLVKKTISVAGLHMISYYNPVDVKNGRLPTPTSTPQLASLEIDPCFLEARFFRHPPHVTVDEKTGLPRFNGLTDDEPMVRKPPSQQRKNVSEATILANKAVYYGLPSSIPESEEGTPADSDSNTPPLAQSSNSARQASASSTGLSRSRTSLSSASTSTATSPRSSHRRPSTSSMRHEPYRLPSNRQSHTVSGSVELPPAFATARPQTAQVGLHARRTGHQRSISLSEVYQSPISFISKSSGHSQAFSGDSPYQPLYTQSIDEDVSGHHRPYTSPGSAQTQPSAAYHGDAYGQHPDNAHQYSGSHSMPTHSTDHNIWTLQQQYPAANPSMPYHPPWSNQQYALHSSQAAQGPHHFGDILHHPHLYQPQPQHPTPSFVYSEQHGQLGGASSSSLTIDSQNAVPPYMSQHAPVPMQVSPSPPQMPGLERNVGHHPASSTAERLSLPQTDFSPLMPSSASYSAYPAYHALEAGRIPQYAGSSTEAHSLDPSPISWDYKPDLSPFLYRAQANSPPSYGQHSGGPAHETHKIDMQVLHPKIEEHTPHLGELKIPSHNLHDRHTGPQAAFTRTAF